MAGAAPNRAAVTAEYAPVPTYKTRRKRPFRCAICGEGTACHCQLPRVGDSYHRGLKREGAMTPRKPVTDWMTDWDHLDPRWREDPYPIWDELRRSCPIAHTERYQGAYLPTRYEDVRAIANDTRTSRPAASSCARCGPSRYPHRRSPPTRRTTSHSSNCCYRCSPQRR